MKLCATISGCSGEGYETLLTQVLLWRLLSQVSVLCLLIPFEPLLLPPSPVSCALLTSTHTSPWLATTTSIRRINLASTVRIFLWWILHSLKSRYDLCSTSLFSTKTEYIYGQHDGQSFRVLHFASTLASTRVLLPILPSF